MDECFSYLLNVLEMRWAQQDLMDQLQQGRKAGVKDGTRVSGQGTQAGGGGTDWVEEQVCGDRAKLRFRSGYLH